MKSAVLTGIRQMEIVDVEDAVIAGPNDVLLKVERVGVCGSDVHYYTTGKIGSQIVEYPYRVGHEFAATVLKVGDDVENLFLIVGYEINTAWYRELKICGKFRVCFSILGERRLPLKLREL